MNDLFIFGVIGVEGLAWLRYLGVDTSRTMIVYLLAASFKPHFLSADTSCVPVAPVPAMHADGAPSTSWECPGI